MAKHQGQPSRTVVLETFAVFAVVSLLAGIFWQRAVFVRLALIVLLVALLVKPLAVVVTRAWLKFSTLLSGGSNRLILAVIFYFFLTPIALLYRLFKNNPLNLGAVHGESFYSVRNHTYCKSDLEKMW
jgi:hypothetical protein